MRRQKFNINHSVWVKLTKEGKDHWEKWFNQYPVKDYHFVDHYNQYTKDGWTQFQMHVLMEIFGERTGMGLPNLFETNIEIELP